ncbi:MAG: hypothetical protein ABI632_06515 [Pseudolysinimonas sp.]
MNLAGGVVAGAIALLLMGSTGIAPAPRPHAWEPGDPGGPTIRMTVVNWGEDVDIAGVNAVYAHLGVNGPMTHIKVEINPPSSGMHGFYGRLTAPEAFGGEVKLYCGDEYRRIDLLQRCFFDVPMSRGVNHIDFDLQSASWTGIVSAHGVVLGASLGNVSVLEANLPYGNWALVPPDGSLKMRGEQNSALRYRIMNTGDMPFRVPDSCEPDGIVWPYQQLLCMVRGERPVYALAGDYALPITLEDPVGGGASFTIDGHFEVKGIDVRPNSPGPARLSGTHG